ncbi:MAG TPA: hypothetical protein VNM14_17580 [Planctomycetota bacterium]|nr:hypothetical protein [Planctomycetota bacterium]
MKRGAWIVSGVVLLLLGVTLASFLRPRPVEKFPLAELVPADAVFYAGFPDYRELETLRTPWSEEIRKRLDPARPHLSGGLAVYVDRSFQWVALARLTRASAALAGAEVRDGAAVIAQTPEALARQRTRTASLAELPEFQALGSRCFFNLEILKPRGRLRDFSAIGFEIRPGPPFTMKGRALYRGGLFRIYLEKYVHAPRRGAPEGGSALQATLTEHFPRVWEEVTHDLLDTIDCEKAEREAGLLSRDLLEGRPFREFLGKIGPGWGLALVPTPYSKPALVVWIDFPDEATKDVAAKMVHRAISDGIRVRRERGLAPAFEITAEGSVWRVKAPRAAALRLGEAFTPAYTFEKNRFVFSTCAATLSAPAVAGGESHGALTLEIGPLLESLRQLAPLVADETFRPEAERSAAALYVRTFTPGTLTALKKQFPDPSDLAKYQETQKAQFEAKALEEISKTLPYQEELTRVKATIEAWADSLGWLERASWSGRFTSEGLDFELRAWPTEKR